MGIYDRDYNRDDPYHDAPGLHLGGQRSLTTNLVIFTCGVYLAQLLLGPWFTNAFSLGDDWYKRPWQVYQLLTYGFLHSPDDLWHILLNMFVLWMFGRELEYKYGRREYLIFYLMGILVAGITWTLAEIPSQQHAMVLGASGGISAVLILYAMNFPYRTVLFMMIIPMPMWVVAIILVAIDINGAIGRAGTVACTAHLGGALFGFLYYRWGGRLERWLPSGSFRLNLRRKPKLRVVDDTAYNQEEETDERVDEILRKIQEHGQDSLTWRERRILEKASREYQKKRQ
jgi:rhomboid family protein